MEDVDKIIEYMKCKGSLTSPKYFTDEDEQDIKSWERDRIKLIWNKITRLESSDRFYTDDCPFCIYQNSKGRTCSSCSYGKRHGICNNTDSDWKNEVVCSFLGGRKNVQFNIHRFVTTLNSIKHLEY